MILRRLLILALAAFSTPGIAAPGHIDHIILGVPDLDRGIAQVEKLTGVRARMGGAHPGMGTRNALLSLGNGTYLELYAPNPAEPVKSEDVTALRKLTRPTPVGWAVTVTDLKALRTKMAKTGFPLSPPHPGARKLPDGSTLRWQAFGLQRFDDENAPFFIRWADPQLHPSRTSPEGCTLRSLTIAEPNPAQLRKVVASLEVPVTVERGAKPAIRVRLSCPAGDVALG